MLFTSKKFEILLRNSKILLLMVAFMSEKCAHSSTLIKKIKQVNTWNSSTKLACWEVKWSRSKRAVAVSLSQATHLYGPPASNSTLSSLMVTSSKLVT